MTIQQTGDGGTELRAAAGRLAALRDEVESLGKDARSAGFASFADELQRYAARMSRPQFRVAVIGAFSAGKSTLVNALMALDLIPAEPKECTPLVVRVRATRDGESAGATLLNAAGAAEALDTQRLRAVLIRTVGDDGPAGGSEVEIRVAPPTWLDDGVELVDTPGTNAAGLRGERITLDYLPSADAILFVTRADKLLPASDLDFLRTYVLRDTRRSIFVVANAADKLKADRDREDVAKRMTESLRNVLPDAPTYFVSARDGLRAAAQRDVAAERASGVPALRDEILRFLSTGRAQAEFVRHAAALEMQKVSLRLAVEDRLSAAELEESKVGLRRDRLTKAMDLAAEDRSRVETVCHHMFQRLWSDRAAPCIQAASARLERALTKLGDGDASSPRQRAAELTAREGEQTLAEIQSTLRVGIRKIHEELVLRLSSMFSRIGEALGSSVSVDLAAVDFDTLVTMKTVESTVVERTESSAPRQLAQGDAELSAGVGATIGLLLLGPIGAIIGGVLAVGAAKKVAAQSGLANTMRRLVRRDVVDVTEICGRFRRQTELAAQDVVGGLRTKTEADLRRVIDGRIEELRAERDALAEEKRALGTLERGRLEEFARRLSPPRALPSRI